MQKQRANKVYTEKERQQQKGYQASIKFNPENTVTRSITENIKAVREKAKAAKLKYRNKKRDEKRE